MSTRISLLLGLLSSFLGVPLQAESKNICFGDDLRESSEVRPVGRALASRSGRVVRSRVGACTVTMISDRCAISAGHCLKYFRYVEFNVPVSTNRRMNHPEDEDIYSVDRSSIQRRDGLVGDDWAVFRLKPNRLTGQLAGAKQGFFPVARRWPASKQLSVTGYGLDYTEPHLNYSQQKGLGMIEAIERSVIYHSADTMGGNSGSAILSSDNEVIGVHTHGGCGQDGEFNKGTSLLHNHVFLGAVQRCIEEGPQL